MLYMKFEWKAVSEKSFEKIDDARRGHGITV